MGANNVSSIQWLKEGKFNRKEIEIIRILIFLDKKVDCHFQNMSTDKF